MMGAGRGYGVNVIYAVSGSKTLSFSLCTLVKPHVRSSVSHPFVLFSFKYTHAYKTKQSNEEKFCLLLKFL